jgi:uncharacterized cupredoxin-like copper-binding protein
MSMVSRRAVALFASVGVSALLLGCASSSSNDGAATPGKTAASGATTSAGSAAGTIAVELSEWSVKAGGPGRAGKIEFNAKNVGTIPHEFVVLKTDADPASLTKDANARVDEAKYPPVGRTKEIAPGSSEKLEASLTAGKYVLLCNIAGHYDLGMHAGFTVN